MSRLTRDGNAEPASRDKRSGANEDRGKFNFPVQLTTSRIRNLTRLLFTLAICDDHTHTYEWREHMSSRRLVCRCHVVFLWSYVCFVLRRFVFVVVLYAFTEAAGLGPIVLHSSICMHPDSHTCFSVFSSFLILEDVTFSEYFCTITIFIFVWRVRRPFCPFRCCFSTL